MRARVVAVAWLIACATPAYAQGSPPSPAPAGNPQAGKDLYLRYSCYACHGYDGHGEGMVPTRVKAGGGVWLARNLVEPPVDGKGGVVVQMPNGQLFNTISNGFSTMQGYAAQIPHADRWAIVAYVRALQRAQNASLEDIPSDQRGAVR